MRFSKSSLILYHLLCLIGDYGLNAAQLTPPASVSLRPRSPPRKAAGALCGGGAEEGHRTGVVGFRLPSHSVSPIENEVP